MRRITVKDMKKILKSLPDDTIVCMYSDSEGNSQSTALDFYVDKVGLKHNYGMKDGNVLSYLGGEDIFGIDQEKDKGKPILILVPSL